MDTGKKHDQTIKDTERQQPHLEAGKPAVDHSQTIQKQLDEYKASKLNHKISRHIHKVNADKSISDIELDLKGNTIRNRDTKPDKSYTEEKSNANGLLTIHEQDNRGNFVERYFDSEGHLKGDKSHKRNGNNSVSDIEHDGAQHVTKFRDTQTNGSFFELTAHPDDSVTVHVQDGYGNYTRTNLDSKSNITSEKSRTKNPDDSLTDILRDGAGNITKIRDTDKNGYIEQTVNPDKSLVIYAQDKHGNYSQINLDRTGLITKQKRHTENPDQSTSDIEYDGNQNITKFRDTKQDGSFVELAGHTDGSVIIHVQDKLGSSTKTYLDKEGKITHDKVSKRNADGTVSVIEHDANGLIKQSAEPVRAEPPERYKEDPQGIDVSQANGEINWAAVKKAGMKFAFIKASDGATMADKFFQKNWAGATSADIPHGAYHFFRPQKDVASQVERFVSTYCAGKGGQLPPVLDLENASDVAVNWWKGLTPRDSTEKVLDWLTQVEARVGQKPIIYTTSGMLKHIFGSDERLANYPLWLAQPLPSNSTPEPYQHRTFWQYNPRGSRPGISGLVDLDLFDGSPNDFNKFLKSMPPSTCNPL